MPPSLTLGGLIPVNLYLFGELLNGFADPVDPASAIARHALAITGVAAACFVTGVRVGWGGVGCGVGWGGWGGGWGVGVGGEDDTLRVLMKYSWFPLPPPTPHKHTHTPTTTTHMRALQARRSTCASCGQAHV